MSATELDLLVSGALRIARVIQKRTSVLHHGDYASDTPDFLAQLIERAASHAERRLMALRTSGYDPAASCDTARVWFAYLRDMYRHLRFVERATVRRTPWSLVKPFEELAERLHAGARFLIRPQWGYNYGIVELVHHYRRVLSASGTKEDLGRIFRGIPKRLYVTSFAGVERLNAPLHVVLGHEVAHPIENQYFSRVRRTEGAVLARALERLLDREPDCLDKEKLPKTSRTIKTIAELRKNALRELMCDHACVVLFGPAALFAFEELGRLLGFDTFTRDDHHPPWRYRLRHALELLPKPRVDSYLRRCGLPRDVRASVLNRCQRIQDLTDDDTDLQALREHVDTDIAYELVRESLPKVRRCITGRLANSHLTLSNLPTTGVRELVERLEGGILPNEYWVAVSPDEVPTTSWRERKPIPADLRAILISAAIDRTHRLPSAFISGTTQEAVDDYHDKCHCADRLVLRAIECSHLQLHYPGGDSGHGDTDG